MREATLGLLEQRCFSLFVLLLVHICAAPSLHGIAHGVMIINLIDTLIIAAAVAVVGRTVWSLVIVVSFAIPAVAMRWLSLDSDPSAVYYAASLFLRAIVYLLTIGFLLRYVFDREVMTADRLWGSAALYVMIGILWSVFYALVDRNVGNAFSIRGAIAPMGLTELLYFSFSTLTTTGFGDIVPVAPFARSTANVEAIVGQLFIAILIAKFVGVYPPPRRQRRTA